MSVSYGFYNSKNGDRKYDAVQVSSIFDGIVVDGILMHYGGRLMVTVNGGMRVKVASGRAWFKHTWTLNDSSLSLNVAQAELVLNRIDAVVLEVDSREDVRANSIKIIKGTPATNPSRPSLVKTNDRRQYPLAYIRVNSGVSELRAADITNCVGTGDTPYATAPLEKMSIDELVAQWNDEWAIVYERQIAQEEAWGQQWNAWYDRKTTQMTNDYNRWTATWDDWYRTKTAQMNNALTGWTNTWNAWYDAKTKEINQAYKDWELEWDTWYAKQTREMTETNTMWKNQWNTWFRNRTEEMTEAYATWEAQWNSWYDYQTNLMSATNGAWQEQWKKWYDGYTNTYTSQMSEWRNTEEQKWYDWWNQLKVTLGDDAAGNIMNLINSLQMEVSNMNRFQYELLENNSVVIPIEGTTRVVESRLKDSGSGDILDSSAAFIYVTNYVADPLMDGAGNPIIGRKVVDFR